MSKNKQDIIDKQIEARVSFILMKAGVTGPEIDQCIEWAFGKDAWYWPIYPDWVDRWNKLHSKVCTVKRNDSVVEWLFVVGTAFCIERDRTKLNIYPHLKDDILNGHGG